MSPSNRLPVTISFFGRQPVLFSPFPRHARARERNAEEAWGRWNQSIPKRHRSCPGWNQQKEFLPVVWQQILFSLLTIFIPEICCHFSSTAINLSTKRIWQAVDKSLLSATFLLAANQNYYWGTIGGSKGMMLEWIVSRLTFLSSNKLTIRRPQTSKVRSLTSGRWHLLEGMDLIFSFLQAVLLSQIIYWLPGRR